MKAINVQWCVQVECIQYQDVLYARTHIPVLLAQAPGLICLHASVSFIVRGPNAFSKEFPHIIQFEYFKIEL